MLPITHRIYSHFLDCFFSSNAALWEQNGEPQIKQYVQLYGIRSPFLTETRFSGNLISKLVHRLRI